MDRRELNRITDHVAAAIDAAPVGQDPFFHLRLANIFPPDVYAKMMQEMPVASDYRRMSGRTKSTRSMNGGGTRVGLPGPVLAPMFQNDVQGSCVKRPLSFGLVLRLARE